MSICEWLQKGIKTIDCFCTKKMFSCDLCTSSRPTGLSCIPHHLQATVVYSIISASLKFYVLASSPHGGCLVSSSPPLTTSLTSAASIHFLRHSLSSPSWPLKCPLLLVSLYFSLLDWCLSMCLLLAARTLPCWRIWKAARAMVRPQEMRITSILPPPVGLYTRLQQKILFIHVFFKQIVKERKGKTLYIQYGYCAQKIKLSCI